jgi:regulator of protease activity HflC (stomatin/prohibitin superfamily)
MADETNAPTPEPTSASSTTAPNPTPPQTGCIPRIPDISYWFERIYKLAVIALAAVVVSSIVLVVARSAVYKIHEYERGLHLRGGRFISVQQPGWHVQIPLVDTVIIVTVSERLGYVEQIPAMASDNVSMNVSLQYTYRVTNPERFALQVADPERIVFEFVQGKLRDVINTKAMADVMNNRAIMNREVMDALKEKEEQYGVQFITVQMQSASPPEEVLTAIKDRMVAVQRQEQAQAEAAQRKTLADADLYVAQKEADAQAYRITTTALADAERIQLTTEAQQMAVRAILQELDGRGDLATKFIDYLIAQELKSNSKWVISSQGAPNLDIRDSGASTGDLTLSGE